MIAPITPDPFASDHQLTVAMALSEMQLASITDVEVAKRLRAIRNLVWSTSPADEERKTTVFNDAMNGLTPEQTRLLCESYARMGELYEVAGLTARDNYFRNLEKQGHTIPGGAAEFVTTQSNRGVSLEDILHKLSLPVFEVVMTMHPTNVQGLKPMQALRKVSVALHDRDKLPADELRTAIRDYQNTPILHTVKAMVHGVEQDVEANLTVRDETQTVLNYLGNIYDDVHGIFEQYDKPLLKKAGYDPLALKLQARFGSWGSAGDKDGNDNVTAEKTLEAIVRHTRDIVGRYVKEMETLQVPELDDWKKTLGAGAYKTSDDSAYKTLTILLDEAEKLTDDTDKMREGKGGDSKDYNEKFDKISEKLVKVRGELDAKKFETALANAYENHKDSADAPKLLDLVRKVRWFGFNFSKIEYRETAREYAKVVDQIIPGYNKLSPSERVAELQKYLTEGIPDKVKDAAGDILKKGATKPLKEKDDKTAIAYHTLKRMELARDHNGIITDMVLAECGDLEGKKKPEDVTAQGIANLLEAQFLQSVVKKDGKKPLLGIVPLFEDYNTMECVEGIMGGAYENPAYKAENRHDNKPTQQVQIAHSDNRRRAGSLAGTAFIHEAHNKIRTLNEEKGIQTQFFEGGSLSDPFRNGVRAISAQVNAFGLHDFAKFTFQGRDLMNYFNHPGATERMFTRQFTAPALRVEKNTQDGTWSVNMKTNGSNGISTGGAKRITNPIVEDIAIAALKKTLDDYDKQDFTKEALGTLLAVLGEGYNREAIAANRGSRAAARTAFTGKDVNTHVGAVIQPIDLDKLRTIPFSMMPQQNRLTLSWVGGQKLDEYLRTAIVKRLWSLGFDQDGKGSTDPAWDVVRAGGEAGDKMKKAIKDFRDTFGKAAEASEDRISPRRLQFMYDASPTFRDAMDKAAFATARTDLLAVEKDVKNRAKAILSPRTDLSNQAFEEQSQHVDNALSYVKALKNTLGKMGDLVYSALTGQSLRNAHNRPSLFERYSDYRDREQASAVSALDHISGIGQEIAIKNNYQDFIVHAKTRLGKEGQLGENDNLLAILLAGGLTSTHSRWSVDDPVMNQHRLKNERPAVMAL